MKLLVIIALIFCSFSLSAQRTYVYGELRNGQDDAIMVGAHVRNLNAGLVTSSNENGKFKIPAMAGDSLVLSSVGFQTQVQIVDSSWFQDEPVTIIFSSVTVMLDEVVVGRLPEYVQFQQMILDEPDVDTTFKIYGIPQFAQDPYPQMEKEEYLNPAYALFHPISTLHQSFSKKEKEKRKMQHILKKKHLTTTAYTKFNRQWVGDNTQLKGDKLTSFIEYCDFSVEYLAKSTLFEIHQRMMALLPDFLEAYEEEKSYREG